jgi:2-polyprenyl-3-methyl-5-hydroxy-6-metoxy-1,4-benzoquinol methylase
MSRIDAVGKRVQAAFARAPRSQRLHVAGRLRSCPINVVADATPTSGRVLDFGCGHGAVSLYLAMTSADRRVTGVDVDGEKLQHARVAAQVAHTAVEFDEVKPDYRPAGEWEAITIVDVLYLLGRQGVFDVIDAAVAALVPGGVLVIKEIDVRPRWKFWFAATQELLATKVLRITAGSNMHFVPPNEIGDRLEAAGLSVEQRPVHQGRIHPHHLIVARKTV